MLRDIMDEPLRLIVVAEDPLARAGLAALLASVPGCAVVAQGGPDLLAEATQGAAEVDADAVVWDMGWEPADREGDEPLGAALPVVALAQDGEQAAVAWALGARALLTREMDEERLSAAAQAVTAGLFVLAPTYASAILADDTLGETGATGDLTPREAEVLALLAEGVTNKEIAQRLSISEHTVKFHVNAILGKLNAQSRTDAVVRATRLGLISL